MLKVKLSISNKSSNQKQIMSRKHNKFPKIPVERLNGSDCFVNPLTGEIYGSTNQISVINIGNNTIVSNANYGMHKIGQVYVAQNIPNISICHIADRGLVEEIRRSNNNCFANRTTNIVITSNNNNNCCSNCGDKTHLIIACPKLY